jgi:hypothetical protein
VSCASNPVNQHLAHYPASQALSTAFKCLALPQHDAAELLFLKRRMKALRTHFDALAEERKRLADMSRDDDRDSNLGERLAGSLRDDGMDFNLGEGEAGGGKPSR